LMAYRTESRRTRGNAVVAEIVGKKETGRHTAGIWCHGVALAISILWLPDASRAGAPRKELVELNHKVVEIPLPTWEPASVLYHASKALTREDNVVLIHIPVTGGLAGTRFTRTESRCACQR
jgi:hypothetical protein